MAKYNDLYVRSTLNDTGNIPRPSAGLSSSPDIIPYGIMPVDNPATFFTGDNFNKVLSKDIIYNADNYIYLRGINYAAGAQSGQMYAYYVPSNLLLYPSTWRTNQLFTSGGVDHVAVSASAANAPFATPEPLVWRQVPYPPPNQHYCMVSRIVTAEHPNPIPNTGTFSDFANWVANNGGIGWRNVSVVAAGSPEILFASDYDQGEEGGLMDVLITATGAPIGSEVWFSSGTPLADGKVIAIPPTKITQSPQTWGTQANIPAQWKTKFNGAYRSNGGVPGSNFEISLRIQFVPAVTSQLYQIGTPLEHCHFGDLHIFDRKERVYMPGEHYYRTFYDFAAGPVRPVLLGSVSVRY